MVNGENIERTYDLSNFVEMIPESFFPALIDKCKVNLNFYTSATELKDVWVHSKSNHQRCSMKKGVLKNFVNFTGKHMCQSLFFNKVAGLRPAALLKKRLRHRWFPVNFAEFLITTFLQNTSGRLLLSFRITWQIFTLILTVTRTI